MIRQHRKMDLFDELAATKHLPTPVQSKEAFLLNCCNLIEFINFKFEAFPDKVRAIQRVYDTYDSNSPQYKDALEEEKKLKVPRHMKNELMIRAYIYLVVEQGRNLRKSNGKAVYYNGKYWQECSNELIKQICLRLPDNADEDKVQASVARSPKNLSDMVNVFLNNLADIEIERSVKGLQSSKAVSVNLNNTTLDISDNGIKLRDFDIEDGFRYCLDFDYDPEAKAPIFMKYLNQVLPNEDKQKSLRQWVGSVFIKNSNKEYKFEKALVLHGGGSNGKSVFSDVIQSVIGSENMSTVGMEHATDDKGYYRIGMNNKLLNWASEISTKVNSELFKQMVSGENVSARNPCEPPITMTDYAKLAFNANVLPKKIEQSQGMLRRFLIIDFDVEITEEMKDTSLTHKIISKERSGVLNWIIQGLLEVLETGKLFICEQSVDASNRYKVATDSVASFIEDNQYEKTEVKHGGTYVKLISLYREYKEYCQESGYSPCNRGTFKDRLKTLKIGQKKIKKVDMVYVKSLQ